CATVEVMDETLAKKTYSIVGADELDTAKNYISWKSPIGAALLGKEVGDSIVVNTPKGELELEILKIEYIDLDT
nr:GreA/GreB family elongation factor [Candidatus Brocadiales bacterium]